VDATPHCDDRFPFTSTSLDRLTIHRYALVLSARERVITPTDRLPNMLRGAFEIAFRHCFGSPKPAVGIDICRAANDASESDCVRKRSVCPASSISSS